MLPTYSTGTVAVTAGGTTVTGSGTLWSGINAKQGDFISINNLQAVLVTEVTDATHLKIPPWQGSTVSGVPYVIYQNYVGRVVGVAAAEDVADMLERLRGLGPIFAVPLGETAPDPSYGTDGQYAYQQETNTWWLKTAGVWTVTSNPVKGYGGTSTSSVVIGTGSKAFTTQPGLAYVAGGRVRAVVATDATKWLEGTVASYVSNTGALTITADATAGSGTFASWNFQIAGTPGTPGAGDVTGPASAVADRIAVFNGTTGKLIKDGGALVTSLAPLASPTFTGTPAAPTASPGTNTTQLATTAFVQANTPASIGGGKGIVGLLPANNSSTPNTKMDIAPGNAVDKDQTILLTLAAGISKTTGAWAAGNNNGALDTGTVPSGGTAGTSTGYHIYVIYNPTSLVTDILFSTSATSPAMPSGYTKRRRIGAFITDNNTGNIIRAIWRADGSVELDVPRQADVNRSLTLQSLLYMQVPTGIKLKVKATYNWQNTAGTGPVFYGIVRDPDNTVLPSDTNQWRAAHIIKQLGATIQAQSVFDCWSNTSGQVYTWSYSGDSNNSVSVYTLGWLDLRDEFS